MTMNRDGTEFSITTYDVRDKVFKMYKRTEYENNAIAVSYTLLNHAYFGSPHTELTVRKFGIEVTRKEILNMIGHFIRVNGVLKYKQTGKPYLEVTT